MGFDRLSPMDQIPYFQTPVSVVVTGTGGVGVSQMLVDADPMRVVLIISVVAGGGTVVASTSPNAANDGSGITINNNLPYLEILQSTHGSLVNAAWYAALGLGVKVGITTLSLYKYPKEGKLSGKTIEASTIQRACRKFRRTNSGA